MVTTGNKIDKTLILWRLTTDGFEYYGEPVRRLYGHSHFISDVVLTSDGNYALSGSWDKTLRLWDLAAGKTISLFVGHTKDVLSVDISVENRRIISGSRDKTIKMWNVRGKCHHTTQDDGHSDWVSCVRFSPYNANPVIVSAGWDHSVKVWQSLTNHGIVTFTHHGTLRADQAGHSGYLNTVAVSPDGSLCASGGKDMKAMLWDLNQRKHLNTLDHNEIITAMCFSPDKYWLCVAYGPNINIWDLKSNKIIETVYIEYPGIRHFVPHCISLAWSSDGRILFAGCTDHNITVFCWEPKHSR